jgi:hypothetical protein
LQEDKELLMVQHRLTWQFRISPEGKTPRIWELKTREIWSVYQGNVHRELLLLPQVFTPWLAMTTKRGDKPVLVARLEGWKPWAPWLAE